MICQRCGKPITTEPAEMSGFRPGMTIPVCQDCLCAVQRVVRKYRRLDAEAAMKVAHEGGENDETVL